MKTINKIILFAACTTIALLKDGTLSWELNNQQGSNSYDVVAGTTGEAIRARAAV